MSYTIENKIALVTGANRGIGKAIVDSFIKHGAAKIYAGVRSLGKANELVDQYGSDLIVPVKIDYNDPQSFKDAARIAVDVEVVVSNAGILMESRVMDDAVIESFEQELEVNVYGLLRIAKAFAPVLKSNGGGAFVQLNSIASLNNFTSFSSYCASKAAAYSFTQALKVELAEQGTYVLSVHPGPIATNMASRAGMADIGDPADMVSEAIVAGLSEGAFHVFPDTMAKEFEAAYRPFAKAIIEVTPGE